MSPDYVAQLIVTDGAISSQPVTVTVTTNTGLAPTAIAAATQTKVIVGSMVQLQGSGTDPQNLPLTYYWTLPTFPMGSAATSSFPSTAQNPSFVADLPGTYGAQLVVNDGSLAVLPQLLQSRAPALSSSSSHNYHAERPTRVRCVTERKSVIRP